MEQKEYNKTNIKKILKIIVFIFVILVILVVLSIAITYNTITTSMKVFLYKDLSTEQEENIRKQLETICNTTNIEYVSRDAALQQMKDFLKEDSYLFDDYNGENNIFPSSYIVKDIKINKLSKITRDVSEIDGIKEVNVDRFYTKAGTILLKILEWNQSLKK